MNFKFLQTSDWHIGAKLTSLESDIAELRRKNALETLKKIIQIAVYDNVNAVLLPGDIFDNAKPSHALKLKAANILNQIPDSIPVYILPGTHDPYIKGGLWDNPLLSKFNIFKNEGFSSFDHPNQPVTIWGVPVLTRSRDKNWLANPPELDKSRINILLYHGDYRGDGREYDEWDYPFEYNHVINAGFNYISLGHHHAGKLIESGGKVLAGYSGSPFGWSFRKSETGERSYIIGNISNENNEIDLMLIETSLLFVYSIDLTKPSEAKSIIDEIDSLRSIDYARVTITGTDDPMNLKKEIIELSDNLPNVILNDKTTELDLIDESENIHLFKLIKKLEHLEKDGEIDKEFHERLINRARMIFSK